MRTNEKQEISRKRDSEVPETFPFFNSCVAAHLRGMRPTLTTGKAIQCLEETQTLTELLI